MAFEMAPEIRIGRLDEESKSGKGKKSSKRKRGREGQWASTKVTLKRIEQGCIIIAT
jgi:hypothetical protein